MLDISKWLKQFLYEPEIKELINSYDFPEVYYKAAQFFQYKECVSALTKLFMKNGVNPLDYMNVIPAYYFFRDTTISSFTVPDNIIEIHTAAFEGCTQLQEVVISDNVQYIGLNAFLGCSNLQHVTLGKSFKEAGNFVFRGCNNLITVYINQSFDEFTKNFSSHGKDFHSIVQYLLIQNDDCQFVFEE